MNTWERTKYLNVGRVASLSRHWVLLHLCIFLWQRIFLKTDNTNVHNTVEAQKDTDTAVCIWDSDRGRKLERYLAPSASSSAWSFSRFTNSSSISVISLSFNSISFSTIDMLFSISIKLILTSCNAFSSSAMSSSSLWFSSSWMTKSSDLIVESSETTSVVLLLVYCAINFQITEKYKPV